MSEQSAAAGTQGAPPRSRGGSILQLILSGAGLSACLLGAGGLLAVRLFSAGGLLRPGSRASPDFTFNLVWVAGFTALLALPSLWYAARRLLRYPAQTSPGGNSFRIATLALIVWLLALAIGQASTGWPILSHLIFPPAAILAAVLPIWWAVELARRDLVTGSRQRAWGVLNLALFFSTPLLFVIEIIGVVALVILVSVFLISHPHELQYLENLRSQLLNLQGDPQAIRALLTPFLRSPWVIVATFTGLAVLVPLLEELGKSMAIWFLLGRNLSPAAGLALGAIAGAGFALPETMINLANPATSTWSVVAIGRAGTGLLHVCTTALSGMGLALAWRSRNYLRPGLFFLSAVMLHGLWNAFSLVSGLGDIVIAGAWGRILSGVATASMVIMALGFVIILYGLNRRQRSPTPLPNPQTGYNQGPHNQNPEDRGAL